MAKPSLYNSTTHQLIRSRVESLSPDSPQKWGKMNLPQTMTHLRKAVETGLRKGPTKFSIISFLFGPYIKKMVMSDTPYKEGLPTAKKMIITDERDFDIEKTKLLATLDKFVNSKEEFPSTINHPLFGKLTEEEWGYSQWKHFDHHLRQFSA